MGKKKKLKKEKKHLVFDEKERMEYLTGFHKRKLARKLKAKEKLDKLLKEERRKIRQKQKETLRELLTSQSQVPEVEHLLQPITYDLADHTVTVSEIQDFHSLPVTSILHTTQSEVKVSSNSKDSEDEIQKMRKLIRDLKTKRINTLKSSAVQIDAKKRQRKKDKEKAKKIQKLLARSSKHTKKKHRKKAGKS